MNCLYTIPLCNFGFAFRHATCIIVKDFGKALLTLKEPGGAESAPLGLFLLYLSRLLFFRAETS